MSIRVEFHNLFDGSEHIMWLQQVPAVGEQVYVTPASLEPGQPQRRVAHVVWDLTHIDHASDHINEVRADVYLEAF